MKKEEMMDLRDWENQDEIKKHGKRRTGENSLGPRL